MDRRLFEPIKRGVCSYFLLIYSCMLILQKLWYSPAQDDLTGYIIILAVPVLMLAGGIFLTVRYKKKPADLTDEEYQSVAAAVGIIGGWAVLAMVLKIIIRGYLFGISAGMFVPEIFLFPLAFNGPFLIAAIVLIRRGSLKTEPPSSSAKIAFLCLQTVLMLICAVNIHQILVWFGPIVVFTPHEIIPGETKWIISGFIFDAAVLILLFVPFPLKKDLKNTDGQSYAGLISQSFTLAGYLLLIVGVSKICDVVIRKYDFFDLFFFELSEFLVQFLPALFLLLVSLCFIRAGKKTEHVES